MIVVVTIDERQRRQLICQEEGRKEERIHNNISRLVKDAHNKSKEKPVKYIYFEIALRLMIGFHKIGNLTIKNSIRPHKF